MKNKGFTLIEVLAVVVLLGIIALIAYPSLRGSIDKSKQALYNEQVKLIEDGLKNYVKSNLSLLPEEDTVLTFTLGQLKQSGNMQIEIKNPTNNRCFSNESLLTVTKRNESYFYEVQELIDTKCEQIEEAPSINLSGNVVEYVTVGDTYVDAGATAKSSSGTDLTSSITTTISGEGTIDTSEPGFYTITYSVADNNKKNSAIRNVIVEEKKYINGIMTSTDNCINEGKCSTGTKVKVEVSPNEKYNFYVINDNTTALTLIMDRNLGDNVAWYEDAEDNSHGPITAVKHLKERTQNWTNVLMLEYEYSDDGGANKYISFTETMRARMLTYTEANNIRIANNGKIPSWLYINLYTSGNDNSYAYWLTGASSTKTTTALRLGNASGNSNNIVNDSRYNGIRPVITLLK